MYQLVPIPLLSRLAYSVKQMDSQKHPLVISSAVNSKRGHESPGAMPSSPRGASIAASGFYSTLRLRSAASPTSPQGSSNGAGLSSSPYVGLDVSAIDVSDLGDAKVVSSPSLAGLMDTVSKSVDVLAGMSPVPNMGTIHEDTADEAPIASHNTAAGESGESHAEISDARATAGLDALGGSATLVEQSQTTSGLAPVLSNGAPLSHALSCRGAGGTHPGCVMVQSYRQLTPVVLDAPVGTVSVVFM